jgi:hypothetical protein
MDGNAGALDTIHRKSPLVKCKYALDGLGVCLNINPLLLLIRTERGDARSARVHGRATGGRMPSSEYFQRQGDLCLRLAIISTEDQVTHRLLAMAQSYKTKAKESGRDHHAFIAPAEVNDSAQLSGRAPVHRLACDPEVPPSLRVAPRPRTFISLPTDGCSSTKPCQCVFPA